MYAIRTYRNILKGSLRSTWGKGLMAIRPQQTAAVVAKEPFLNGSSSNYVEDMYASWLENPKSVHKVSFCVRFYKQNTYFLILFSRLFEICKFHSFVDIKFTTT